MCYYKYSIVRENLVDQLLVVIYRLLSRFKGWNPLSYAPFLYQSSILRRFSVERPKETTELFVLVYLFFSVDRVSFLGYTFMERKDVGGGFRLENQPRVKPKTKIVYLLLD